jgi:flagellar biogenesis protein FliO
MVVKKTIDCKSVFRILIYIVGILTIVSTDSWGQSVFQANDLAIPEKKQPQTSAKITPTEWNDNSQTPAATSSSKNQQTTEKIPDETVSAPDPLVENTQTGDFNIEKQLLGRRNNKTSQTEDTPQSNLVSIQTPSLWRTSLSLLVVLALIGGGAYLFRRFTQGAGRWRNSQGMTVLARSVINPKQTLCLVKFGRRLVLVGVSPNHMASLDTVEDPEEISHILGSLEKEGQHSISNTFDSLIRRETSQYAGEEFPLDNPMEQADLQDHNQQWYYARGELTHLLDKVKGLTRIRLHRK